MARPKKATVDYFPHVCTHGQTMFILEQRYGNDGYAFWFKLLEMLGAADGQVIDLGNPATMEFLSAKTRLDEGLCVQILDLLAKLGAVDTELWQNGRLIWCQKFVDNIADAYSRRKDEMPKKPFLHTETPPQESFCIHKPLPNEVSADINGESKVKESKVKESINSTASSEHEMTEKERLILDEFSSVDGYPYDTGKDLLHIRKLAADFPLIDLLAESKAWATYKLDKPLDAKSNPRSQFRTWVSRAKPTIPAPARMPWDGKRAIE